MKKNVNGLFTNVWMGLFALATLVPASGFAKHSSSSSSSSETDNKPTDKWFVVVHENVTADATLQVPEYADFANSGTYFSNYHGVTHPSQPNYIAMIAGDTFTPPNYGDNSVDFPNSNRPDANSTIIDLIEAKGLTWKVYLENYPSPGFTGDYNLLVDAQVIVYDFKVTSGPAKGDFSVCSGIFFGPQASLPSATLIATPNLDGTPAAGQDFTGKIVLVSRGTYPTSVKIKNAQNAGAVGVVVPNTKTTVGAYTPGGFFNPAVTDSTITIPAFGLSYVEGLYIVNAINSDPTSKGELNLANFAGGNIMYARKHNPFISFLNISTNPERAAKLVNAEEFARDVANNTVPDFAFYIPNQYNDGHDSSFYVDPETGVETLYSPAYAGSQFATTFGLALKTKSFTKDRVFVLTFDENDFVEGTNSIYCAFYGENVKKGAVVNGEYNHYNLLRTIEDSLKVGNLRRNDAVSVPMTGWRK